MRCLTWQSHALLTKGGGYNSAWRAIESILLPLLAKHILEDVTFPYLSWLQR